jgi:hypothetical protein
MKCGQHEQEPKKRGQLLLLVQQTFTEFLVCATHNPEPQAYRDLGNSSPAGCGRLGFIFKYSVRPFSQWQLKYVLYETVSLNETFYFWLSGNLLSNSRV